MYNKQESVDDLADENYPKVRYANGLAVVCLLVYCS
jgi:hypothetical protein